jgi:hypothetical protein
VRGTGIYYTGGFDLGTKSTPVKLYRFAEGNTVELARVG